MSRETNPMESNGSNNSSSPSNGNNTTNNTNLTTTAINTNSNSSVTTSAICGGVTIGSGSGQPGAPLSLPPPPPAILPHHHHHHTGLPSPTAVSSTGVPLSSSTSSESPSSAGSVATAAVATVGAVSLSSSSSSPNLNTGATPAPPFHLLPVTSSLDFTRRFSAFTSVQYRNTAASSAVAVDMAAASKPMAFSSLQTTPLAETRGELALPVGFYGSAPSIYPEFPNLNLGGTLPALCK